MMVRSWSVGLAAALLLTALWSVAERGFAQDAKEPVKKTEPAKQVEPVKKTEAKAADTKAPDAKTPDAKAPATKGDAPKAEPAKEPEKKEPEKKEPVDPALQKAADAFPAAFEEWKKLLGDLRALQYEYGLTKEDAKRKKIEEDFQKLVTKGEVLKDQVLAGAKAAYKTQPLLNRDAERLLASQVQADYDRDAHEEAADLALLLIEGGYKNPLVHKIAGISSFYIGDFDHARAQLDLASKAGVLDDEGRTLFTTVEQSALQWKHEQETRIKEAQANDLPRVLFKTNKGDIEIELFENEAPNTVANFINLVEKGFYNGLTFHRVLPHFMAQGGDPKGDGTGGPDYTIACECYEPNRRLHYRGSLSMAHAGRDTGGSQFFLTFKPTTHLDGKHTVFGRVIKGIDVLAKLQRIDPQSPDAAGRPDKIEEAKVLRKRPHPYVAKTSKDKVEPPKGEPKKEDGKKEEGKKEDAKAPAKKEEGKAPETKSPEAKAPEATKEEPKAPEVKAPEVKAETPPKK